MYKTGEHSPIPMNSNYLKLKQLIQIAREVGQADEPWFKGTVERLSASWNESLYQKTLDTLIRCYRQPLLDNIFAIPVTEDEVRAVDGPFKIATIDGTDIEFGLHPLQLQMHGVIGGSTGFGKTTFILSLCQQLITEGEIRFWLIDPKRGGDYRVLAKHFSNVVVLGREQLKCNPCSNPENIPMDDLIESISEVLADSWEVYDAGEGVIMEIFGQVFEGFENPTFIDFIRLLEAEISNPRSRWSRYLPTLGTRVVKAKRSLKHIVDCKDDYFPQLINKNVIFEFGSLIGSVQRVLAPWIISKLVFHKHHNPTPNLSHVLIFDEAQAELWAKRLEQRGRSSHMANLATQCRSFGMGILVLAQNPATKLMSEIIGNSSIKICFHMNSGQEILEMAGRHMGLTQDQKDELYHLDRGEAVCRLGIGYTEPVRLKIHNVPKELVSDDELAEIMKPQWDELLSGIEPAIRGRGTVERPTTQSREVTAGSSAQAPARLSNDQVLYLRVVSSHPWRLLTEISSILNNETIMGNAKMGITKAGQTRKFLQKRGLLESFAVTGTGKSGRPQCDIVTEKAGMGAVEHPRGGNIHSWWCYRVGCFFRDKGAEVKIGDTESGNEIDISVFDGKNIGIEIVITGLVADNLPKHLSYFDRVLILCAKEKKKEMEKLVGGLGLDVQNKVEIGLLKDYFISL